MVIACILANAILIFLSVVTVYMNATRTSTDMIGKWHLDLKWPNKNASGNKILVPFPDSLHSIMQNLFIEIMLQVCVCVNFYVTHYIQNCVCEQIADFCIEMMSKGTEHAKQCWLKLTLQR